ncbi:DUF805 domain-containing protein [Caulobacter sp. CCH9-E1]|uniref:DUF805 domain-containing protein n=1 Tax=Caulobacter sp. CCH9-E1 TaxID=1768768 RepID=UPI000ACA65CE|nr:DUF805 domain-containing protein [Caulobacter sp. CCH9-E1]
MIQQWFNPRGAIGRQSFVTHTAATWLIGNLGFIAIFLVRAPTYSFARLGALLDHPAQALDMISQAFGAPFALVTLGLWLAQVWALAALSAKRLHDLGQGGWLAGLSLVPGIQVVFWLALCVWPSRSEPRPRWT